MRFLFFWCFFVFFGCCVWWKMEVWLCFCFSFCMGSPVFQVPFISDCTIPTICFWCFHQNQRTVTHGLFLGSLLVALAFVCVCFCYCCGYSGFVAHLEVRCASIGPASLVLVTSVASFWSLCGFTGGLFFLLMWRLSLVFDLDCMECVVGHVGSLWIVWTLNDFFQSTNMECVCVFPPPTHEFLVSFSVSFISV